MPSPPCQRREQLGRVPLFAGHDVGVHLQRDGRAGVAEEHAPGCRFAIARSAVYNVYMPVRAMQEATFMILTALADGSQHGYGIMIDVQEISGGRVRLRAGTLYSALDRLRADELIGVDREEVVDGRLRRYYRLTPAGTRRLA